MGKGSQNRWVFQYFKGVQKSEYLRKMSWSGNVSCFMSLNKAPEKADMRLVQDELYSQLTTAMWLPLFLSLFSLNYLVTALTPVFISLSFPIRLPSFFLSQPSSRLTSPSASLRCFLSPALASSQQPGCSGLESGAGRLLTEQKEDRMEEDLSTKQETLYSGSWQGETELEMILFQLDFN